MFGRFKRKAPTASPPHPALHRDTPPAAGPALPSIDPTPVSEAPENDEFAPNGEFIVNYSARSYPALSDIARAGATSEGFNVVELPAIIRERGNRDDLDGPVVYVLNEVVGSVDPWTSDDEYCELSGTMTASFLLITHRKGAQVSFGIPYVWVGETPPKWSVLHSAWSNIENTFNGYFTYASPPPHLVRGEFEATMLNNMDRAELTDLVNRIPLDEGQVAEVSAILRRGTTNDEFPRHLVIEVDGKPVGRVFSDCDDEFKRLNEGESIPVVLRLEVRDNINGHARASGAIWTGGTQPQWSAETLKPWSVYLQESADARAADRAQKHEQASAALSDETHPVSVTLRTGHLPSGVAPHDLIEPIQQLKREKRWEEALTMLYAAIESEERARAHGGGMPAPWYTEHAAICHRRLKQHEEEVVVLKRYLAHLTPEQRATSKIQARLTKIENG
ncbi:hypothetical protein [Micrococcus luteus]|uniref:hypothetical protein n=1 Tax=Micrococcus luteus TaxID=1270 RepID=UPI0011A0F300|nr:hypothetical protein [Micrococcus luteus]